jgi:Nucleotidyl transferase AbiEii toxin, Type IV TA system
VNADSSDRSRLRQSLDDRLARQSRDDHTDIVRLRRGVVFERVLARLSQNDPAQWVLKGGMALEVRMPNRARSTRDLDLATRRRANDIETIREALVDTLIDDSDRDGFAFILDASRALPGDEAGRAGARFSVDARLAGKTFQRVRIDVVARTDELRSTETLTIPT